MHAQQLVITHITIEQQPQEWGRSGSITGDLLSYSRIQHRHQNKRENTGAGAAFAEFV
jgi:hypothetical protein